MRILYAILESSGRLARLRDFEFDVGTASCCCDREFDHMEIERAGS